MNNEPMNIEPVNTKPMNTTIIKIKPIKNEQDYERALEHVERLREAAPGSTESDNLDVFSTLIEAWEQQHIVIAAPDPVEAIKFRMEQQGLEDIDLVPALGQRSRVSEVLNKKRKLSIKMI